MLPSATAASGISITMEIVAPFALTIICIILLNTLSLVLFKSRKLCLPNSETNSKTLKPLPGLPVWTLALLGRSFTFWQCYIAKLNKIVEIRSWSPRQVFINDFQLGKELFKNQIFCGKKTTEFWTDYTRGAYGIASSEGPQWKEQKRFCQHHLKSFGLGTKSMEMFVQEEVSELLQSWADHKGEIFSPNKSFYLPVLNSIWLLLTGKRASAEDQKLVSLVYRVYEGFRGMMKFPDVLLVISKLKMETIRRIMRWIPIFSGAKGFDDSVTELRSYLKNSIIEARKKAMFLKNDPSNLVDAYLNEINKTTDTNSQFYGQRGEMHLLAVMTELFVAGGDTTATMLAWAMLHLIRNPEIQETIQKEIDTVIGTARAPTLADKINCPYTEAFINEVLRFSPTTSMSLPHSSTEDTNIGPYSIQKGTVLFLNIYNICHDPRIWENPEHFEPRRFLSADGMSVVKNEALCTFSLGARRCLGEATARDSIFLYVSAICQRFVLKRDPRLKCNPPIPESKSGVLVPNPFYMIAVERNAGSIPTC